MSRAPLKLNRSSLVVAAILLLPVGGAVAGRGDQSVTPGAPVWSVERFLSDPGQASEAVGGGRARWMARDLGTLGGRYSRALAINDQGQVVGVSRSASRARRYFLWEKGKMSDLGLASETQTQVLLNEQGQVLVGGSLWESGQLRRLPLAAHAMNDRGQIIGYRSRDAVLWDKGRLRDLDGLSTVVAINNDGLVVGDSYSSVGRSSGAFRWRNGRVSALSPLRGLPDCRVVAVNSSGQILGYCARRGNVPRVRAVIWHGSRRRDLGTLGHDEVMPQALNERGQVVGETRANGKRCVFLWDGQKMRALWQLAKWETATVAINDHGQVVGSRNGDAVVWERGVTTRLGRLGPLSASAAYAINENDQIAGYSMTGEPGSTASPTYTAPRHAFLWTKADR